MTIDGVLNEPVWTTADSIWRLTQVEPIQGDEPTARTTIRILMSMDALMIGVRADYSPGVRVVGFARDRDAQLQNEDHVKIVLDTYLDGRSGYVFAVNPNGARYDALVANQGEGENANWDGVWEARTSRDSLGWTAEIRIPLKSLLFRRGLTQWGLNVQRRIQALQETDRWNGASRDYKVTQTARAGRLVDLPPFDLGLGLSIRPALTTGAGYAGPDSSLEGRHDVSLDVTQRLGANTLGSLTVNTDFAETEVDTRRTNLTRFSLFFPEKRTFFLEGADIFDFGSNLGDDLRAFNSRTIGLIGDVRVPIDVGGKVNGRLGGTNFGALVLRTGDVNDSIVAPASNIGVLRLKQNILGESTVGVIGEFGDPLGARHSWTTGADFVYHTSRWLGSKNLTVGAWGMATDRDSLVGRKTSFGGLIDYPNDLWDTSLSYKWIGDGFVPSLGFVPRTGVQVVRFASTFQPRPRRPIGPLRVRQMFHEFESSLVTDLDRRWLSYSVFTAPINWRLESGDRFEFNIVPQGERLDEPFEIVDGVTIAPGKYSFVRYRLEGGLATKRRLSGQYTWRFGQFYDGTLDQFQVTTSWKPSSLVIVEFSGERNYGRLRAGDFTTSVLGTRVRVNISSTLQLNTYVQYDSDTRSMGSNTRMRWTFSPLGELFVVYNHNLSHDLTADQTTRRLAFASNQLLAKVQYAFRY
ncbi:MAG: carbohydrate binding family 9 domain-containing protein [Gemmatimonadaceae bacterium]